METTQTFVTINAVGRKAHTVFENGREYLVVPMTSIVEGVLNGSQGALFYPAEEIKKNPRQWDGATLIGYHPTDPTTGLLLKVDDPRVPDVLRIGTVRNSRVRDIHGPTRLQHDGWFDVERVKAFDAKQELEGRATILNRLKTGKPVELSTGLFTTNLPAPAGSHHNGTSYAKIATNYVKDHIAVLADQRGACALDHGCGVGVTNMASVNEPDLFDLAVNCGGVGSGKPGPCPTAHSRSAPAIGASIEADKKDTFKLHHVAMSMHTIAARAYGSGKEHDYHMAEAERHRLRADHHAGVTNAEPLLKNPICVQNSDAADAASNDADSASEKANKSSGQDMAALHKTAAKNHLKAAAKHGTAAEVNDDDGDEETAQNHMQKSATHLRKAARHQEMAGVRGGAEVYNQLTNHSTAGDDMSKSKTELVQWLTTNCAHFKDKSTLLEGLDEATLTGMKGDAEKAITANAVVPVIAPVINCGGTTLNELLKSAPAADQETWAAAQQITANEKARLIGLLTTNMTAEQSAAAKPVYSGMSLPQLTVLASAIPVSKTAPTTNTAPTQPAIYVGSVVPGVTPAPVVNRDTKSKALRPMEEDDYIEQERAGTIPARFGSKQKQSA